MRRIFVFMLALQCLSACETTDYSGFKRIKDSLHYRLAALGDEDRPVQANSYVTLLVSIQTIDSQEIAEKVFRRIRASEAYWPDPLKNLIFSSHENDSLEVIGTVADLKAVEWFDPLEFDHDSSILLLRMSFVEVLTGEELLQKRAEERGIHDPEIKGYRDLNRALDSLGLDESDLFGGIYFRSLHKGKGKTPGSGSRAYVHYRTYLANGREIDNTFHGTPFEYDIGKPDQVIHGFAVAISRMRENEEALFVIPHEFAYGAKGSSSGIVPPYQALIYKAKLVEIRP